MKYASVTDVVRRIKEDIHGDYRLQSVAMEGNIIGLKRASNGHYYMNIRDDQCSIRAIVFRSRVTAAVRAVREGDSSFPRDRVFADPVRTHQERIGRPGVFRQ